MAYLLHQLGDDRVNQQDTFILMRIIPTLGALVYRLVIVPLVAFLPAPLAYWVACLYGDWRYQFDSNAREQILRNLEEIFGDRFSLEERSSIARDFFRRHSCELIDTMRLARKGRALRRLVEIRGLEHLTAALSAGKGAVLCTAHFGSFNAAFSLIGACGFPITVVGTWRSTYDSSMSAIKRLLWQRVFEKQAVRHRRPNIEPLKEPFGAAIRIAEVLRSNELIAIPIDAPTLDADRARAIPVDFLGRHVLLLPGSVDIAQLTDSPLLMVVMHRSADWRHQVLEISPPLPLDGDAVTVFKRCVKMLEAPVRQNPAYWDWWANRENLVVLGLLPA